MEITLIGQTDNPVQVCACAAHGCTHTIAKMPDDFGYTDSGNLVNRVIEYGHESIAEMAIFTFKIDGLSRAASHQLVRHRMFSYAQQSLRYCQVDTESEWYVLPESIKADLALKNNYTFLMKQLGQEYNRLLACGIKPEDARSILPHSTKTNIVMTGNARAWREFLQQRMCIKAQKEIQTMAVEIYKHLLFIAPPLFQGAFPHCGSKGECKTCKGYHNGND